MKKLVFLSLALVLILGGISCNAQGAKNQESKSVSTGNVEVFYFHFTRRCMTCNAVESVTKESLEAMYSKLLKSGKITFKSINLDNATNTSLAEKCGAEGQSLLVIGGEKRIDLTTIGFINAVSNPEKLKAELKKAIDPLI